MFCLFFFKSMFYVYAIFCSVLPINDSIMNLVVPSCGSGSNSITSVPWPRLIVNSLQCVRPEYIALDLCWAEVSGCLICNNHTACIQKAIFKINTFLIDFNACNISRSFLGCQASEIAFWLNRICNYIAAFIVYYLWKVLSIKNESVWMYGRHPQIWPIPAEFSSNPNRTPACNFLVILKALIIFFRCVWSGLELNSAADWPSRERFEEPWCDLCTVKKIKSWEL